MNTISIRRSLAGLFAVAALGLAAVAPVTAAGTQAAMTNARALEATVLFAPSPFTATDKRQHLVYEISLQNTTAAALRIDALEVLDARRRTVVATVGADAISGIMLAAGVGSTNTLAPGGSGMLFLDVTFAAHARVPARLVHRFALSPSGDQVGAATRVGHSGPLQLGPPLRGGGLFAGNGCCATSGHARQVIPNDGRQFIPQRYAIDFLQLEDGSPFSGDPSQNESYFIFGDDVIAAAPGRVVAARDGVPENTPGIEPTDPTFDEASGNYVLVDLGGNRFAFYAHLHTGSVRVRVGDRVRLGQVLGLVGNTGASSEPHLHFHVANVASPLFSNGVPYVFREFQFEARVIGLDTGNPSIVPADPPLVRQRQLPLNGDIIAFPPG